MTYGSRKPTGRPGPFSFFLPFSLSVTLALLAEFDGTAGESRKVLGFGLSPRTTWQSVRGDLQAERQLRIIKLSVISHSDSVFLGFSSCLTTAADPPGRHNITLPKQVLNFVDFFPSF